MRRRDHDELLIALFLATPHTHTISTIIWPQLQYNPTPQIAAASAVLLGVTVFVLGGAARLLGPRKLFFPVESFADLHEAGLLGVFIPPDLGGLGASYQTFAAVARTLARGCGSRAMCWVMHGAGTPE